MKLRRYGSIVAPIVPTDWNQIEDMAKPRRPGPLRKRMSAFEIGLATSSEKGLRSATVWPIAASFARPSSSGQVSGTVKAMPVCRIAQAIARMKPRLPPPITGWEDCSERWLT